MARSLDPKKIRIEEVVLASRRRPDGLVRARTRTLIHPALRALVRRMPSRFGIPVWRSISRRNEGGYYFFEDRVEGRRVLWGGVFEHADFTGNLFRDLGRYEPETIAVARSLLGAAETPLILDVGANSGQYLSVLKALYPGARVHCFEPFAASASFLEELAGVNGWKDVKVNACLVGASEGSTRVHYSNPGESGATAVAARAVRLGFMKSEYVPQVTLDAYAEREGLAQAALAKIDVEGGELEVLKGAERFLSRARFPVVFEALHTSDPALRRRHEQIWKLFRGLGYEIFRIGPGGTLEPQKTPGTDPRYLLLNFLARPLQK
ncbi:MAG TPA: FkbM family methyltransferase [Candidatus Eisenbacteria bacterium]|nr:FkbM family methyltransferase [Candidatus Eisenbacteria bacterium]